MVGLLHAMAFMVLLLIGWVIWNNKPLPLEFERVYFELKRFFVTRDQLLLKQKLMSLYGRYVSTYFHERKRHACAMSENESNALHALRKDSNIVISKPDKGNGVVVLNRADYVAKMQTILSTNSSPAITITMSLTLNFRIAWGTSTRVKRQLMKTRTGRSIQLLPTHQQCTVFLKYISLICLYDQFCHL